MHALISTTYKKKKLYLAHVAAVNERARNACVRKAGNVRMYARELAGARNACVCEAGNVCVQPTGEIDSWAWTGFEKHMAPAYMTALPFFYWFFIDWSGAPPQALILLEC